MKTDFLFNKSVSLWLSATVAVVALSACTDDDMGVTPYTGEEIQFKVANSSSWTHVASRSGAPGQSATVLPLVSGTDSLYLSAVESEHWLGGAVASRSEVVSSNEGLETIGVFATRAGMQAQPAYMSNVEVTKSSNWTPKAEYLWPGDGALHFNAYSPYVAAGADEGILAVPQFGADDSLTLDYLTPADVADQIDLMYAVPCDASASPCALELNHALTAIRFVTGAQMSPCTVSKIEIEGVASRGTLNLESGEWSELSGSVSYSVSPDVKLDAALSSKYVAPDVAITADDQTFILLPQLLSDDAKIILTVEINGNVSTFEASLAGQTWSAGRTVTYRLSATAESSELIFSVVDSDGNAIDKLNAKYTGSKLNYTVKSYYSPDGATMQPVEWDATLIDKDGNELSQSPDWILNYVKDGSGETSCTMTTDMTTPVFLQMSDATRTLQSATDINTTSGHEYYNLSNSTGADAVENTANCYLINAPGKYSIPLVYGNAVKDGATNSSAYVSTIKDTRVNQRSALLTFINHLGNAITDPYIYNNAGCEPSDAVLVWEEKIGLVRNVSLSADKKSLEFEIPAGFIRQGNADVAVRDKNGTVMWSWQLWVTDFVNGSDWYTVPVNGTDYHLYPHTLGRVNAGDRTQFTGDSVIMRLTQRNVPDGVDALTVDITIDLAEKVIDTNSYYSFYQWGRKDPMISAVDQFYDGNHNEVDAKQLPEEPFGDDHKQAIMQSIMHPELFQTSAATDLKMTTFYINLWDIDDISMKPNAVNEPNVKTIYDPCPVGAKVPIGNEFLTLMDYEFSYDSEAGTVYFTLPSGRRADFSMLGYRSKTGNEATGGSLGGFWTAVAAHRSNVLAEYFHVGELASDLKFSTIMPLYGFGLRPVMDE
ncbi:MAG: fimbrillin family protein [Muribaculaceae bacterium]|nr:fimbrillin family protein [Muribaculaceae bacterium]